MKEILAVYINSFIFHYFLSMRHISEALVWITFCLRRSRCLIEPFRYTQYGGTVPYRPAEDLAFAVARFVQNNGSFFNYYMVNLLLFSSKYVVQCHDLEEIGGNLQITKSFLVLLGTSTMEEQILDEMQLDFSSPPAMIMMLLLMNMVNSYTILDLSSCYSLWRIHQASFHITS